MELPPKPDRRPAYQPRLFPSSILIWNEMKILERILYKVKNQHKSTSYFKKLQQLRRTLRCLAKVEDYLQAAVESGKRSQIHTEWMTYLHATLDLVVKTRDDCRKCYTLLEAVYDDLYFVPLTTTAMALVARINFALNQMHEEMARKISVYTSQEDKQAT